MMKKMMILVGMAAMLLCGCGRTETVEVKTECEAAVEEAIETSEALEVMATDFFNEYVDIYYERAIYEWFGEDLIESQLSYDNWGVYYQGRYNISWDALDEIAYNLMINEI